MKKLLLLCALLLGISAAHADDSYEDVFQRSRAAYQAKQLPEAEKLMRRALALAKTPVEKMDALTRLAVLAQDQKRFAEARQIWTQLKETDGVTDKDKATWQLAIASSYLNEDNIAVAYQEVQKYLQMPGVDARERNVALLLLATGYNNVHQWSQALAIYEKTVSSPDASVEMRAFAQRMIGETYFDQGKWSEANAAFLAVAKVEGVSAHARAEAKLRSNEALTRAGNADESEIVTETFALRDSFLTQALAFMATGKAKRDEQSLARLRDMLAAALVLSEADSVPAIYAREMLAETDMVAKDYAKSRAALIAIIAFVTPTGAADKDRATYEVLRQKSQLALAASYRLEGQTERARQEYQKMLSMPNLDATLRAMAQQELDELDGGAPPIPTHEPKPAVIANSVTQTLKEFYV